MNPFSCPFRSVILLVGWLWAGACTHSSDDRPTTGSQLAQAHCGSCHQFPEPSLLDRATWRENVLPVMGLHLGLLDAQGATSQQSLQTLLLEGDYPSQPQLSRAEWEAIKAYYKTEAPSQLDALSPASLPPTDLFTEHTIPVPRSSPPGITCVKIDPLTPRIYAADAGVQTLYVLGSNGQSPQVIPQQPAISALTWAGPDRKLLATHLGFSLAPRASAEGFVSPIHPETDAAQTTPPLINFLSRPTQTIAVDLTGDGVEELLTCCFGYRTGKLSYWQRTSDGTYEEHVLREETGALQAEVHDTNADGRNDITVLFAQGDERLVRYENRGDGQFQETVLLRFPPAYGSTSFELHDFNGDERLDLLYTCGDNADYSPVLKPYHGAYIFMSQGDGILKQKYFFPMHGAYRAIARDFDQDGDLDIASIAFFADYAQAPERSFVYLEHRGTLEFTPTTRPIHPQGRWMTMDAGDVDNDGDTDLVLGSYTLAAPFGKAPASWRSSSGVLWLENTLSGKSSDGRAE